MWDDSPAWREATLGTPAERLAKFRHPDLREKMIEQPPMLFPLQDTVILRTRTERRADGYRTCWSTARPPS